LSGLFARIAILLSAAVFTQFPNGPQDADVATRYLSTAAIRRRVVKSFDFSERKLGNFETVPMNWLPV